MVGHGALPITGVFRQLRAMEYRGGAHLEYDLHAEDTLPGMIESFAHMRGVLAGLGGGS